MNVRSLKLAGAAAGLLFLVGGAPNVYAQTEVLTNNAGNNWARNQTVTSTFRFTQSMILNSIGFVTTISEYPNSVPTSLSYTLKGGGPVFVSVNSLSSMENGLQWYTLATPVTMNVNDVVTMSSLGELFPSTYDPEYDETFPAYNATFFTGFKSISSSVTVSVNHDVQPHNGYAVFSNGNLRVSNPGSNVAPEPGSFALALTGGGALLGICIRRRRNAA